MQQPTLTPTVAVEAWVRLLRGHAAAVRTLNAQLTRDHGLTVNDYEALLVLSHAEDGALRRTDLAGSLQLTPSGVTRLLEGLEREGYVAKRECTADRRVVYAALTDEGAAKLRAASCSHVAAIEELFGSSYEPDELETLAALLGRLPGSGGGVPCAAGQS